MQTVKVTVGITTYNLEQYIAPCLDSILQQKTSFVYKILVVDDASTDGTRNILQKYRQKFPEKLELILKEKNGGYLESSNMLFNRIKTPYFSFIDGDDFWLRNTRLQEAVDFLDQHPQYTMYGANSLYLKDGKTDGRVVSDKDTCQSYSFQDYIQGNCPFVHTSAIVLRNVVYQHGMPQNYIDNEHTLFNCVFRGEDIRFIEHLRKGMLFVSNNVDSVYRIHAKGIWQGASSNKRLLEACLSALKYQELFPEAQLRYQRLLEESFRHFTQGLQAGYQLSDTEHTLYVGLLNQLHAQHYDMWNLPPQRTLSLKYKILLSIYRRLKTKLAKKGVL